MSARFAVSNPTAGGGDCRACAQTARPAKKRTLRAICDAHSELSKSLRVPGRGACSLAKRTWPDRDEGNETTGAMLNTSVASRDKANVNINTRVSTEAEYGSVPGSALVIILTNMRATTGARSRPAAAPASPSKPPSTKSCETIRRRLAPSAYRIDISRARLAAAAATASPR